jgi:hypothetical protein
LPFGFCCIDFIAIITTDYNYNYGVRHLPLLWLSTLFQCGLFWYFLNSGKVHFSSWGLEDS